MKIFISAMPGVGNLGDDLISTVLVNTLVEQHPDCSIGVYIGEEQNPFGYSPKNVEYFLMPSKKNLFQYFRRLSDIRKFIKKSDVYIVGGGGLIQDVHFRNNCHYWLKYRYYKHDIRAIFLGVGVGPILHIGTKRYLTRVLADFSYLEVRDEYSCRLIENFGLEPQLNTDIVQGLPLLDMFKARKEDKEHLSLGCSIRPWKDLSLDETAKLIKRIVLEVGIKEIILFVFEYTRENREEYEYAMDLHAKLAQLLALPIQIVTYNKDDLKIFIQHFLNVDYALASRFHANILWQKIGVPTIPISYAPKVKSLYEDRGGRAFLAPELFQKERIGELFQKIKITDNYVLPNLKSYSMKKYKGINKILSLGLSFMDFWETSFNSIKIRLRSMF